IDIQLSQFEPGELELRVSGHCCPVRILWLCLDQLVSDTNTQREVLKAPGWVSPDRVESSGRPVSDDCFAPILCVTLRIVDVGLKKGNLPFPLRQPIIQPAFLFA